MNQEEREKLLSLHPDTPFLKYTFDELVRWCTGRLIIAIGEGRFREEVYETARFCGDWAIYNRGRIPL